MAAVLAVGTAVSLYRAFQPERVRSWVRGSLASWGGSGLTCSDDIDVDPWRLGIALRDVVLRAPNGEEILRVARVSVAPHLGSILLGRLEAREVTIDRPSVRLVKDPKGVWNLETAIDLAALSGPAKGGEPVSLPSLRIRGGQVLVRDEGIQRPGQTREIAEIFLNDLHFSAFSRGGRGTFKGEWRHPFLRRVAIAGTWEDGGRSLEIDARATKVDLAGPLDLVVGEAVAAHVRGLGIEGFADLEGRFRYGEREGFALVGLSGRLIRCRLTHPQLLFPIREIAGGFSIRGRTLQLGKLEGSFGEGRLVVEGTLEFDPSLGITGVDVQVAADALPLDHRLRDRLPAAFREVYDNLRPMGSVGIRVGAKARKFPPSIEDITATLTLNKVDFAWVHFPYRFRDLTGEATLDRGQLVLTRPIIARNGPTTVTMTGRADVAGSLDESSPSGGEIAIEARVERLLFDEELREALPPAGRAIWDNFQPAGPLGVIISVVRRKGRDAPAVAAFIDCQGVRISYSHFPYELLDIHGRMHFESIGRGGRLTLAHLTGHHGGQRINGAGVVEWGEREMFRIDLDCDDLRMDDDLRAALSPSARQHLADFNFQGHAKTGVTIHSTSESAATVKVEVDLIDGQVAYALFPYPLQLGGGHFTAIGENSLRFSNVVTREKREDGLPEKPKVVFNGGLGYVGGEELLDFHFDIEDLNVDQRLIQALPPPLRSVVLRMGLEGAFRGKLDGTFSIPVDRPEERRLVYRATEISARDAAIDFGLRLRQMQAKGEFVGGKDASGNHFLSGTANVDSFFFNRLQLRDTDLSFAFGQEHAAVTVAVQAAAAGEPIRGGEYRPSAAILGRLGPDRIKESFQMQVKRSNLYGGDVRGFLVVDAGKAGDFAGEFTSTGVQVSRAAPDVFGAAGARATGEGRGQVSFEGSTADARTITGKGEGRIEKARLIELPLFVGLVSLLAGDFSRENFFNEVALTFGVKDGKFVARSPDGIQLTGQGMSLRGGGTLDFEGKLDLTLLPEFIHMKIPVLDTVFNLLKRGLAQVWVTGDLNSPRAAFVTGAGLLRIPVRGGMKAEDRPLPRNLRPPDAGKLEEPKAEGGKK